MHCPDMGLTDYRRQLDVMEDSVIAFVWSPCNLFIHYREQYMSVISPTIVAIMGAVCHLQSPVVSGLLRAELTGYGPIFLKKY
ncbi:hypothetical protein CDAR_93261 [Caerostris darwini]|uniref:Uncharacterized protein n=1 Tax=Caerostris darwini TaxID=1538125 RepID=A0AAV4UWS4_9ARAC|nr:hypothetical protein CDAR_93261 [Caerostris darwini]